MDFDPKALIEDLGKNAPKSLKLSPMASEVLRTRVLRKDDSGNPVETPESLFQRVAETAAGPESAYGGDSEQMAELFRLVMFRKEFLPATPTLTNAGQPAGQLASCFVLPVGETDNAIKQTVRHLALVQQTGGGTGFSFSNLKPEGFESTATGSPVPGPVSCMETFDAATEAINPTAVRRGANMGILQVDHPDIIEFIAAKLRPERLSNFNISVAVTDRFMQSAEAGDTYPLIHPGSGATVGALNGRKVLRLLSNAAWKGGDPGVIFLDEINRANPTPHLGPVKSTNPCGELPLLPYESCNLGSVNLARFVLPEGGLDWKRLKQVVWVAVRFLDNIIDANAYPIEEIQRATSLGRKIGLGVMGFADALIHMGIPYTDDRAVALAERVMGFIAAESRAASVHLAASRGPFPEYERSALRKDGVPPIRNATTNTVAPTGTLSILADCSAGIEPLFALAYTREILAGRKFHVVNPLLESRAESSGVWSDALSSHIERHGTLENYPGLPAGFAELFVTALQIPYAHHLRIQVAFQKHVDNSVSKTINLPHTATPDDVQDAISLAFRWKCKGVTVYRDGSRPNQVLRKGFVAPSDEGVPGEGDTQLDCPDCGSAATETSGCAFCPACAWSRCA